MEIAGVQVLRKRNESVGGGNLFCGNRNRGKIAAMKRTQKKGDSAWNPPRIKPERLLLYERNRPAIHPQDVVPSRKAGHVDLGIRL